MWDEASRVSSLNLASTLENLGVLYFDQRRYDEAGGLFDRAVTINERALGQEHPDVARGLTKLARADLARGYYAEAEVPCQRALHILEKASQPDYTALIEVLMNYALVLEKTKRKADAELLQTRAMVYRAKLQENRAKNQTAFSANRP
jgi:tetratricopeptide (TPR) repeat protein